MQAGPTKAIQNITMLHCYIASKTCHRINSPETGSPAARHAFSSTSFHCFSLSGPRCLHQPYQTRLSRGIGCNCLNVGRLKRGSEAAKYAPVPLARHWLTLLSNCLTLARRDERSIFIIHGVSSASIDSYCSLIQSLQFQASSRESAFFLAACLHSRHAGSRGRVGAERQRSGLPIFLRQMACT